MPTKEKIIEDKNFTTDTLSKQVRNLTYGLLGIMWAFLIGNTQFTQSIVNHYHNYLIASFVLSILTLLCDYLQYFAGQHYADILIKESEGEKLAEKSYNRNNSLRKFRENAFYAKQVLLVINVAIAIVLLVQVFNMNHDAFGVNAVFSAPVLKQGK